MNTTHTTWYTTQFITNSLKQYLREKGWRFREPEEQYSLNFDSAIVSTKLLSKEVIEIRGTIAEAAETQTEEYVGKSDSGFIGVMRFLFDLMLSPVSFFTSINGDEKSRCLCLPDLKQYRKILDKLGEYFASNQMHLKIYLINENGIVDVFYLNPGKKHRE
jgi:hypothetical protein